MRAREKFWKWRRYAIRLTSHWQGVWFQTWRPAWFGGTIRYVTCGLGYLAFFAGDPDNWRELMEQHKAQRRIAELEAKDGQS